MNIFFNILQKCAKREDIVECKKGNEVVFFANNYAPENRDIGIYLNALMYNIYYEVIKKSKEFVINKLSALNWITDNIFISNQLKEKLIALFSKAQQTYFSLNRFINIYKHRKYPTVVTNDLSLNTLTKDDSQTVVILQAKSVYYFSLADLINIIETAICNSPNFFSDPLTPKNPYNNQPFSLTTLYNIYFAMKQSKRLLSIPFHLYFLEDFNKNTFRRNNEMFIRDFAISKYVLNTHSDSLVQSILSMISNNVYINKLIIDSAFPKDLLVNIFRPFLLQYYKIHYSLKGMEYKQKNLTELNIKFKKFYDYNPLFGRKIVKFVVKGKGKYKYNCYTDTYYTDTYYTDTYYTDTNPFITRTYVKKQINISFNTKHLSFYKINLTNDSSDNDELSDDDYSDDDDDSVS
jgi:hypothetical protein